MKETVLISKCCRRAVGLREDDAGDWHSCYGCGKECETDEVCAYCLGKGFVAVDETDQDGNIARGVDTEKCVCQLREPDEDDGRQD